jgi:hypothetical protein
MFLPSTGDALLPNFGANVAQQVQSSQMQVNYNAVFTSRQSAAPVSVNGIETSNLQQNLEKSLITRGLLTLRNGPVGGETQRTDLPTKADIDRWLKMPVTHQVTGANDNAVLGRNVVRTGSELDRKTPPAVPSGNRIQVLSLQADGTYARSWFVQNPTTGQLTRLS